MRMRLKKTTSEEGRVKIEIEVDGIWTENLDYELSRKLTGTTSESRVSGVFLLKAGIVAFGYGNYDRCFSFECPINKNDSIEILIKTITDRINKVRQWVAECKANIKIEVSGFWIFE